MKWRDEDVKAKRLCSNTYCAWSRHAQDNRPRGEDTVAAHVAKFVAKDMNQLTEQELEHLECSVALFTELDMDEFFVCF